MGPAQDRGEGPDGRAAISTWNEISNGELLNAAEESGSIGAYSRPDASASTRPQETVHRPGCFDGQHQAVDGNIRIASRPPLSAACPGSCSEVDIPFERSYVGVERH